MVTMEKRIVVFSLSALLVLVLIALVLAWFIKGAVRSDNRIDTYTQKRVALSAAAVMPAVSSLPPHESVFTQYRRTQTLTLNVETLLLAVSYDNAAYWPQRAAALKGS